MSSVVEIETECASSEYNTAGSCALVVQAPGQRTPATDFYKCVVSGEGPRFLTVEKGFTLEPFVEASKAHIRTTEDNSKNLVELNCSTEGLPPPRIVWTINGKLEGAQADCASAVCDRKHEVDDYLTFEVERHYEVMARLVQLVANENKRSTARQMHSRTDPGVVEKPAPQASFRSDHLRRHDRGLSRYLQNLSIFNFVVHTTVMKNSKRQRLTSRKAVRGRTAPPPAHLS
ncbi:hypothetical protein EVAR_92402_1 [Eumeta japonica]|uniref:Ig-like domain-containing protein n=1 Tax=Eumeta variegata TaxID=151549 RepID=A0A4C1TLU2_EUMVA|nr:hypothetical protein EVAR_92402_1 [Eumeta japonica]